MKRVKKRFRTYESGDCYLYHILCVCGEEVGGWSVTEAEDNWKKHKCSHVKSSKKVRK